MERRENRKRKINNFKMWKFIIFGLIFILISIIAITYYCYFSKFKNEISNKEINDFIMASNFNNKIDLLEYKDTNGKIEKGIDEINELDNKLENEIIIINDNYKENNSNLNKNNNEIKISSMNDKKDKNEIDKLNKFIKPVKGEILKKFSDKKLIYSKTLDEWTTHLGLDFKAKKTEIVKCVNDGKVKEIKNDPKLGLMVRIEHDNNLESIYGNLLTTEFIKEGEYVKQGQTIATVGNTARFEIADESHLHFELKKNGKNIDPNKYF